MNIVRGITADKDKIKSFDDGKQMHAMNKNNNQDYANKNYGVFGDYDDALKVVSSGTSATIKKGTGIIYGRQFALQSDIIETPTLNSSGYICITYDENANVNEKFYTEIVEGTALTQQDIYNGGSKFQAPLCSFVWSDGILNVTQEEVPNLSADARNVNDGKLNVVNPQEVQGPLTIDSGNTVSMLNLKSNSTGDKDITIKDSGNNRVGLIRYKNDADGNVLLANYYDNPNSLVSSLKFDKNGAYVNNNQLLEVRNAFTQTSADNRYLKLTGGTLTGFVKITGQVSPIRIVSPDATSTITPFYNYWQDGTTTRFTLQHNPTNDDILLTSRNQSGTRTNGLGINQTSIIHYGNDNKVLAYKDDVMSNTGDKNITGAITWTRTSTPMQVVNTTDSTLTSIGDILNIAGNRVGRFMYRGSGTNGEVWAVGYNSSGASILVGTKATIDGVYDYGLGGILTLNASAITRNISTLETQISMQTQIDNQQEQINLLNAQVKALINNEEVPLMLKTTKVQSDELIKLNEELNKSQEELKAQIELDEKIKIEEA